MVLLVLNHSYERTMFYRFFSDSVVRKVGGWQASRSRIRRVLASLLVTFDLVHWLVLAYYEAVFALNSFMFSRGFVANILTVFQHSFAPPLFSENEPSPAFSFTCSIPGRADTSFKRGRWPLFSRRRRSLHWLETVLIHFSPTSAPSLQ